MAEQEKKQQDKKNDKKADKKSVEKKPEKKHFEKEENFESLIRIAGYDIPGTRNIYTGLTRVKGVSWAMSNAACLLLKYPHSKKISELTKDDIQKIEHFLKNPSVADYMKNRRFQLDSGKTSHLIGTDLDIAKDFDIRRLKKIRTYKGIRHASGQPVRGQRTRSHFRKKAQNIKRPTKSAAAAPAPSMKPGTK